MTENRPDLPGSVHTGLTVLAAPLPTLGLTWGSQAMVGDKPQGTRVPKHRRKATGAEGHAPPGHGASTLETSRRELAELARKPTLRRTTETTGAHGQQPTASRPLLKLWAPETSVAAFLLLACPLAAPSPGPVAFPCPLLGS